MSAANRNGAGNTPASTFYFGFFAAGVGGPDGGAADGAAAGGRAIKRGGAPGAPGGAVSDPAADGVLALSERNSRIASFAQKL